MEREEILKYVNKRVLIVLNNGFRFTGVIPFFKTDSFEMKDKYGQSVSIDCEAVSLIYEQGVEDGG